MWLTSTQTCRVGTQPTQLDSGLAHKPFEGEEFGTTDDDNDEAAVRMAISNRLKYATGREGMVPCYSDEVQRVVQAGNSKTMKMAVGTNVCPCDAKINHGLPMITPDIIWGKYKCSSSGMWRASIATRWADMPQFATPKKKSPGSVEGFAEKIGYLRPEKCVRELGTVFSGSLQKTNMSSWKSTIVHRSYIFIHG